ncbi:hypothetical protein FRC10_004269, partial [Ceratobasidium sp. 414]
MLRKLKDAVQQLPKSTQEGASDGIVGRNFASQRFQGGEGNIWETIDQAYTWCFSKDPTSNPNPENNVLKGQFGMDLILEFFDTAAKSPELKSSEVLFVQLKLNQLMDLVYAHIQLLPRDILPCQTKKTRAPKGKQHHGVAPARSKNKPGKSTMATVNDSENDGDYRPPTNTLEVDSEGSGYTTVTVGELAEDNERTEGTSNHKAQQKRPGCKRRSSSGLHRQQPTKKKCTWSTDHHVISSVSGSDADSKTDTHAPKESRQSPQKQKWALSHFQQLETTCFQASNFMSHLRVCKNMPPSEKWEAPSVCAADNAPPMGGTNNSSNLGAMFATSENASAQEHNPAALHKTCFRSTLIQGVIHDNYLLTFREGPGMISVFHLVNLEVKLPSHQTMRRDLDKLYAMLSECVLTVIKFQSQKSQVAISSDTWSSKNSIYSLAGIVVSFIDKSWVVHHLPIDIVHLDAEHSGASMGKQIFGSIQHHGIGLNLIASVTDNTSNNHTMNDEIARRYTGRYGVNLNVDNMTVTCVAHTLHLVCRQVHSTILSNLGVMNSLDSDEVYALAKAFDPEEPNENNRDTADEQAQLDKECNPKIKDDLPPKSTDDSDKPSDLESEPEHANKTGTDGDANSQNASSAAAHAAKVKKILNALEK